MIQAPPDLVWRWIFQIGTRRAGFYSYDLFKIERIGT
jgi:hypothetical protein